LQAVAILIEAIAVSSPDTREAFEEEEQAMSRPTLEVADIIRTAGDNLWKQAWNSSRLASARAPAHFFRLALEKGSAGARYHAVAEEGLPLRDIAETIGRKLNVRVISKSSQEAAKLFTWLTPFIAADNPSKLTQERLAWRTTQPKLIPDIDRARISVPTVELVFGWFGFQ
jgi:hypothetical protein